ncbi:TRAP transporter small permease [Chloroflexota bacterium]
MLVVVTNVISRLFGVPILGTFDVVELLIIVLATFSLGYCAVKQGHVAVTIVFSRLSQRTQTILTIVTIFLSLSIWILAAWTCFNHAGAQLLMGEATDVMEWPIYPFRYVFAFGVSILCLVLLVDLLMAFKKGRESGSD